MNSMPDIQPLYRCMIQQPLAMFDLLKDGDVKEKD